MAIFTVILELHGDHSCPIFILEGGYSPAVGPGGGGSGRFALAVVSAPSPDLAAKQAKTDLDFMLALMGPPNTSALH